MYISNYCQYDYVRLVALEWCIGRNNEYNSRLPRGSFRVYSELDASQQTVNRFSFGYYTTWLKVYILLLLL